MMCACICAAKGTWGTMGKKVTGHDTGKKEKKKQMRGKEEQTRAQGAVTSQKSTYDGVSESVGGIIEMVTVCNGICGGKGQ